MMSTSTTSVFWQRFYQQLAQSVLDGHAFSNTLGQWPMLFSPQSLAIIKAGEATGNLAASCQWITELAQQRRLMRNKLAQALRYPIITLAMTFIISSLLIIFVLPSFNDVYRSLNAPLPSITTLLLHSGQSIRNNLLLSLLIVGSVLIVWLLLIHRFPSILLQLQRIMLKIPYFGPLLQAYALSTVFRILQITHNAGITLNQSLDITLLAFKSALWRQALQALNNSVQAGKKISDSIAGQPVWPPLCYQFIAQAEQVGNLTLSFSKLSEWYQQTSIQLSEGIIVIIEPLLLLINSVMIASLLLAIYLPMLRLGEVITP